MGADFLEQDIVLTKDQVPIVVHDTVLDTVTNVATVFPGRGREDGRFYAIDFTWDEITRLNIRERTAGSSNQPKYPRRYPGGTTVFGIPSLAQELEMIAGLNRSTGKSVGIYPEIKSPRWHRDHGGDISQVVLGTLADLKVRGIGFDKCYLQCFDPSELRRLRHDLGWGGISVQLIADDSWQECECSFREMRTARGLQEIAQYANGIGVWIQHLCEADQPGQLSGQASDLVRAAHACGLTVHAFTVRGDDLPVFTPTLDNLHEFLFRELKVDGVFTDFPDLSRAYVDRNLVRFPG
jgi:glycerophosphoryl diester phosphodiesterase